jgi:hypothetical protein
MIQDKPSVAMPVHALDKDDFGAKNDSQIVETWPLIQAYGLDSKCLFLSNSDISRRKRFLHDEA